MARLFDSDDIARAATPQPLYFTEFVDCPRCDTVVDGIFTDDSITVEDIVDPPTGSHACPTCGHAWTSDMTGWTLFTEAG